MTSLQTLLLEILTHFECQQCGSCCNVCSPQVTDDELILIAKRYGTSVFDELDENNLLNVFKNPCSFRESNGCKIYDARGLTCKLYPFSLSHRGFVALIPCPMGIAIKIEYEHFLISQGIKIEYNYNLAIQESVNNIHNMYARIGYQQGVRITQLAMSYDAVPLFHQYLGCSSTSYGFTNP